MDKKGAVILPYTKDEPGIAKTDEEKVCVVKAEQDTEDVSEVIEIVAEDEGIANDVTVKNQNGEAANNDDEVDKNDGLRYDDDDENDNVEENVIEEIETTYNIPIANYFSPLMIPASVDIPLTTYSHNKYLSSSISTATDHLPPQLAQLPGPPEGDQQQHQLAHDQDDHWEESCKLVKTSDARKNEDIELEDKEEGFVGPKLPRVMTNKEFKAVMDRLLGDKYN